MDSLQESTRWILPRAKVSQFFEALLGYSSVEVANTIGKNETRKKYGRMDGSISTTSEPCHLVPGHIPPELIREAYQKGAALFFPQAFLRVDIGIPVKPDGEDTCALLMVQVKNEEKGHIGNSTSETAKKALNIPTTKLQSSVHVFALFKQKHPDTTEILAAEGPLTVIAVWLDANLYPSAGIKPNNDNQSKGHQEMVLEHLVHFRDALPMSRFSNAMEESEQAEDLLSHLVVMIIPEIKCYYAIRFILPLENQEIAIKFHVFYQFLVYYLCKILSKQEQALNSNSVVPVQYPNKGGK